MAVTFRFQGPTGDLNSSSHLLSQGELLKFDLQVAWPRNFSTAAPISSSVWHNGGERLPLGKLLIIVPFFSASLFLSPFRPFLPPLSLFVSGEVWVEGRCVPRILSAAYFVAERGEGKARVPLIFCAGRAIGPVGAQAPFPALCLQLFPFLAHLLQE